MIIDDIVKWIEEQPYWQQVIAKKILDKSHIYDEDIEDFFLYLWNITTLNMEILIEKK